MSRLLLAALASLPVYAGSDTSFQDPTRVKATGHNAFSRPVANMPLRARLDFSVGNSFFRNPWVAAPATTDARDGLGPLFNTNACQNCHVKDGRGHPPQFPDDNSVSMLVRLSVDSSRPLPVSHANHVDPHYGGQLQDFALPGIDPEGKIDLSYSDKPIHFSDGTTVTLREPHLSISKLAYGPLHPSVKLSARIAPPMIGLGLLEAIPEQRLQQLAEQQQESDDGISGKLNRVWDIQRQQLVAGRFGWKAGQPTLKQQNAAAFNGDMGITSKLFMRENCRRPQTQCVHQAKRTGDGKPEIAPHLLDQVTFYTRNLAVPKRRRPQDKQVLAGEEIFHQLNCHSCHTPHHKTSADYPLAWLAGKTIAPYSDLLLHDMGEELADNTREFEANGREWRTPPLWGIGLTQAVTGIESYLHDGRARTLEEAILWHGGEGKRSRDDYLGLDESQRRALLSFLQDL